MGKFILNDLLSEGTVYTLDGQNIFDNQYFSFIGMTDDSFYCSTNVPDGKVVEFPRNGPVMNRDLLESAPMVEPEKQVLDVTNVSVPKYNFIPLACILSFGENPPDRLPITFLSVFPLKKAFKSRPIRRNACWIAFPVTVCLKSSTPPFNSPPPKAPYSMATCDLPLASPSLDDMKTTSLVCKSTTRTEMVTAAFNVAIRILEA